MKLDDVVGEADVSDPQPGDVFSFASVRGRVVATVIPLTCGGAAIAVATVTPGRWWFLAIPVAIVLGPIIWRAVHLRLELRWDGVVVRNTYRTRALRWADIEHVYTDGDFIFFQLTDRRLASRLRQRLAPRGTGASFVNYDATPSRTESSSLLTFPSSYVRMNFQ